MRKPSPKTTAEKVADLLKFQPSLTTSTIAMTLGVSAVWVREIIRNTLGLRTSYSPRRCHGCDVRIKRVNALGLCRACVRESYSFSFTCAGCAADVTVYGRHASDRRYRNHKIHYCSRRCKASVSQDGLRKYNNRRRRVSSTRRT